jgi:LacI family transcriptional regulator
MPRTRQPPDQRPSRASAQEVAAKAGVAVDTVWQILGGRGERYHADTRARVEGAAAELGYRRHAGAVAISTGRFRCLAMVTSTTSHRSVWDAGLFEGLERRLSRDGYHIAMACLADDDLRGDSSLAKTLRERSADGLILNYVYDIPGEVEAAIRRHRLAAVWVNRRLPAACAHPDDHAAGESATQALIALGHRRIAYLSSHPTPHYSEQDRAAGYAAAMRAADLRQRALMGQHPPGRRDEWMRQVRELLSRPDRPTALVTYGPFAAYPVLRVAQDLGLQVPRDLSLCTFAPAPACDAGPALTTWLIPFRAMGEAVADHALKAIAGDPVPACAIPFAGVTGATQAPPPRARAQRPTTPAPPRSRNRP